MRPASLLEAARRIRADGDWDHHVCEFLDAFYGADGDARRQAGMITADPGLVGSPRPDAYLGGVGEHLARRWGLPIPAWVRGARRYLDEAWFLPDEAALRGYLLGASPVAFRTRLIFTGADPLQRARFPYDRGSRDLPLDYPPLRPPSLDPPPLRSNPPSAASRADGSPPDPSPRSPGGSAR